MNDQIPTTTIIDNQKSETQPVQNHQHKPYWGLVLLVMGIVLALAEYKMYKGSFVTAVQQAGSNQNSLMYTEESTTPVNETTIREDQTKSTAEVSDEILDDLDSLENSDITAPIGGDQLSDMKE